MDTFVYNIIINFLLLFVVMGMYMFICSKGYVNVYSNVPVFISIFFYQNFVIFMSLSKGDRTVSVSHVYLKFSVV
jgi:ABC-type amino acid transport system permease subunit